MLSYCEEQSDEAIYKRQEPDNEIALLRLQRLINRIFKEPGGTTIGIEKPYYQPGASGRNRVGPNAVNLSRKFIKSPFTQGGLQKKTAKPV